MARQRLDRIMNLIFDRPLLITPQHGELIGRVVADHAGKTIAISHIDAAVEVERGANQFIGSYRRQSRASSLVPAKDGTAILTIDGELVNRGAWIGADSGLISYEGLTAQLMDVLNDDEVTSLILDLNTPGGEAGGISGVGALIAKIRQTKPVIAVVNDMAASAGYWLASQADEIFLSPTSLAGSIGVIVLHLDRSEQLEKAGIKATVITAGAHKADFSSLAPLSDDAKERLQTEVDQLYGLFVGAVAQGRGARLSADAARATEAMLMTGDDAVKAGLADRMGDVFSAIEAMQERVKSRVAVAPGAGPLASAAKSGVGTAEGASHTGAISTMADDVNAAFETAQKISKLCNDEGVPALASELMKPGVTFEQAQARVREAKDIRAAVEQARKFCPSLDPKLSDSYLAGGRDLASVREDLFERMNKIGPEAIRATHGDHTGGVMGEPHGHDEVQASWGASIKRTRVIESHPRNLKGRRAA